ncbi:(4Fe-4S)-binding protein [Aquimarina sp. MMG016]|uniref:(4Fe-4S)-binding protein n=1 Tax=Aquimarina sp. MMG016 TaxID=2822690 RepID=UPI001B3A7A06|nr:(4Fe-4S)-binding protein [Aquimarina sp. MMG016]MBQ4819578.1 (4Fe-4S)-binding protein [Aquimarina sp. MMG016]
MATNDIRKEYTNGELTVVWKPGKCIHAGICVKTLPDVYDPSAKPWITPENATTENLKQQITQCPSGALSYYMNADKG